MKKVLLVAALILAMSGVCYANPFLVCDPADNPTEVVQCVIEVDGGAPETTPYPLHYDLSGISSGAHSVKAAFDYGVWGETPYSDPLAFTKPSLGSPSGLGLQAD